MFEITSSLVKSSLVYDIRQIMGEDIKISKENIVQNVETPCIIVKLLSAEQHHVQNDRYYIDYTFNINYMPNVDSKEPEEECLSALDKIAESVKFIRIFSGFLDDGPIEKDSLLVQIQGDPIFNINDEVLVCVVTIRIYTIKKESGKMMANLDIYYDEKEEIKYGWRNIY